MVSTRGSDLERALTLEAGPAGWKASFSCFAGPCELHLPGISRARALELAQLAATEAWRIQDTYSRYNPDSWLHQLNTAGGQRVELCAEAAALLAFADAAHGLSGGAFDPSSGVLRQAWTFQQGAVPPHPEEVDALLARIGWRRAILDVEQGWIRLPPEMELDLGGIGKEFAVDRVAALLTQTGVDSCLVNFGGDLLATGSPPGGGAWLVGLDHPLDTGKSRAGGLELLTGALATSGDARRFLLRRGRRYGHILDARTGWPPRNAPRSVTVLADSCSEAGMLATLAVLKGSGAEAFLEGQGRKAWILR